jgi:outer membrane protein
MKKIFLCLCITQSIAFPILAQYKLTLEQALQTALDNNYQIRLAKNSVDIAKSDNSLGNAGFLPTVSVFSNMNNNVLHINQENLSTGTRVEKSGAVNNFWQSGILANWTVFDGTRMFATRQRLQESEKSQKINLQAQTEQISAQVMQTYYTVVLQNQLWKVFGDAVRLSEQRLKLAQDKYSVGSFSKTEVLRAEVDLNSDKSQWLRQKVNLQNSKVVLNQLLAKNMSDDFEVEDSLILAPLMQLETLKQASLSQNISLQQIKANKEIQIASMKEVQSERLPTLDLLLGYNYNRGRSEVGFANKNQTNGVRYGFAFNYVLFDGFNQKRRAENAKLNLEANDLQLRQQQLFIEQNLTQSFNTYLMALELLNLEQENSKVAERNFTLAQDQSKLGLITSIELREAQQNLILARSRLTNAKFEVKLAETELLRLSGQLLK